MKCITLPVSYNYFGDTVISYNGNSFNVFQYNCSAARDLLKQLQAVGDTVFFMASEPTELVDNRSILTWQCAIPYLIESISVNDAVNKIQERMPAKERTAGEEIAGHYGY